MTGPTPGTMPLLAATTNPAKAARLAAVCTGLPVTVRTLAPTDPAPAVTERALSHLGNAVSKAVAWSAGHTVATLASDGGVVIPALGADWDSLRTRRATGEGEQTDEARAGWLLRRMHRLSGDERAAHWVEAVAVAREGRLVGAWQAQGLAGRIADAYVPDPHAEPGFWVSGLWVEPQSGLRLWELDEAARERLADPWLTLAPPLRELLTRMAA